MRFKELKDALGDTFGALDNQVGKWVSQSEPLVDFFPKITSALGECFPSKSSPIKSFDRAAETYQRLLAGLDDNQPLSRGYLNLRFYIMLNGFLSACQESLEKHAFNHALDTAALVEKSYYKPFFFDRVNISREEIKAMLSCDLAELEKCPKDQKGILKAIRIRKGTTLILLESYCPLHPELYPVVAELESIASRKDASTIEATIASLRKIESAL